MPSMEMTFNIDEEKSPARCLFTVRVTPRAKRNAVTGVHDGALKISLKSPPVDGKANEALIIFLAETLAIKRAQVEIVSGEKSRTKRIAVRCGNPQEILKLLS